MERVYVCVRVLPEHVSQAFQHAFLSLVLAVLLFVLLFLFVIPSLVLLVFIGAVAVDQRSLGVRQWRQICHGGHRVAPGPRAPLGVLLHWTDSNRTFYIAGIFKEEMVFESLILNPYF